MTLKRTYDVIKALGHKIDFVSISREKSNPCWVGEIRTVTSKDFLQHQINPNWMLIVLIRCSFSIITVTQILLTSLAPSFHWVWIYWNWILSVKRAPESKIFDLQWLEYVVGHFIDHQEDAPHFTFELCSYSGMSWSSILMIRKESDYKEVIF